MSFMDQIPEADRELVNTVLANESLSIEEKLSVLKDIITDADAYVSVYNFLHENAKKDAGNTEELPPSENDFLKLVSEAKKRLMSKMLEKRHFSALERQINREKTEVQNAFQKWKSHAEKTCPGMFDENCRPCSPSNAEDSHNNGNVENKDASNPTGNDENNSENVDEEDEDEEEEDEDDD